MFADERMRTSPSDTDTGTHTVTVTVTHTDIQGAALGGAMCLSSLVPSLASPPPQVLLREGEGSSSRSPARDAEIKLNIGRVESCSLALAWATARRNDFKWNWLCSAQRTAVTVSQGLDVVPRGTQRLA